MLNCAFDLNGHPMSAFRIGALSVPAFSGRGANTNRRSAACLVGLGPIPPGAYYIFDRQGGGHLDWFRNLFTDHSDWFALYAIDGQVDDETFCDRVRRGHFRLHPRGRAVSVRDVYHLDKPSDFQRIRSMLRGVVPSAVPGSDLKAYGKVLVK